jgi:dTDP-4-amino-4,6-dideoxygalactose transaminase
MDGIRGAILSVKLRHVPQWNQARRRHARLYSQLLSGIEGVVTPTEADYGEHVYHIYCVQIRDRDGLIRARAARDIHCGIHYPVPIHLQDAYKELGLGPGRFVVAERLASRIVSLPMYAELTEKQIQYVAEQVRIAVEEAQVA